MKSTQRDFCRYFRPNIAIGFPVVGSIVPADWSHWPRHKAVRGDTPDTSGRAPPVTPRPALRPTTALSRPPSRADRRPILISHSSHFYRGTSCSGPWVCFFTCGSSGSAHISTYVRKLYMPSQHMSYIFGLDRGCGWNGLSKS